MPKPPPPPRPPPTRASPRRRRRRATPPSPPTIARASTSAADGVSFGTPDGRNELRLRLVLHMDGRAYFGDVNPIPDTFLVRRARPYIEGTLFGIVDYRLLTDFGQGTPQLLDACIELHPFPWLRLRAGRWRRAHRPRVAAVGLDDRARRALVRQRPNPAARHRRDAQRRRRRRHVQLPDRHLQRRARQRQRPRLRPAVVEGLRRARLLPPAAPHAQGDAREPRPRRRRQLRHPQRRRRDQPAGLQIGRPADDLHLHPDRDRHPHDGRARHRRRPARRGALAHRAAALLVRRSARPARRVHRLRAERQARGASPPTCKTAPGI